MVMDIPVDKDEIIFGCELDKDDYFSVKVYCIIIPTPTHLVLFFFFKNPPPTEIYPLPLPAALPILRDRPAPRFEGARPPPRADLHARDEGRDRRPRRERRLRPRRRDRRRPGAARGAAAALDRPVLVRGRPRARARDHPRRHEVRVRARLGRPDRCRRRGAHARLVPLLAGRRLHARPLAALIRQAVRAGLGERLGLGQDAAVPAASSTSIGPHPTAHYDGT